jgi:hypothetical protein
MSWFMNRRPDFMSLVLLHDAPPASRQGETRGWPPATNTTVPISTSNDLFDYSEGEQGGCIGLSGMLQVRSPYLIDNLIVLSMGREAMV